MRHSTAPSLTWERRLARRPQGDVWHVRRADGTEMVAKQITAPTIPQRARLWKLVRRSRTLGPPLVPFVDAIVGSSGVWLLREFDPGVALPALTAVAPLSRRQAAATAAGCLIALSRLHRAGVLHGRMHGGNVFIEPDGSVHIVDAGLNATLAGRRRQVEPASDLLAAAALICQAWPDVRADRSSGLRDLFEAARSGDAGAARAGLEMLAASVPESSLQRSPDLALGAVGARLLVPGRPHTTAPPSREVTPAPPPRTPVRPRRTPFSSSADDLVRLRDAARARAAALLAGRPRLHRTPLGQALAASLALAAAFAAAHVIALPASSIAQLVPPTHQDTAPPAARAPKTPPPAPAGGMLRPAAASSAGFVRQVELVPVGACVAGGSCALKSVVDLQAPHAGVAITWEVVAVDRCTGAQTVLRSSSQPLDPSWNVVWATDQYTLPSPHPALIYAVTVAPWRVASAPVATTGACGSGT